MKLRGIIVGIKNTPPCNACNTESCPKVNKKEQEKVPFSRIPKGHIFVHQNRVLIKTSQYYVFDNRTPISDAGLPMWKMFNAIRLTHQPGSRSSFSPNTMVTKVKDAHMNVEVI